jgi:hypothetical protein
MEGGVYMKTMTQSRSVIARQLHRGGGVNKFETWSTVALMEEIVTRGDKGAVGCLMARSLFRYDGHTRLMPELILDLRNAKLRGEQAGGPSGRHLEERVDRAYDQTLMRFYSLPSDGGLGPSGEIDCRRQYRAALSRVRQWRVDNDGPSELAEEQEAARVLQTMVCRHFHFSWLDACRAHELQQRYFWGSNGSAIELRRPVTVDAQTFREWLEQRYGDLDMTTPGVRELIQREVDARFGQLRFERWDAYLRDVNGEPCRDQVEEEETASLLKGLANLVAAEKAANLEQQRPSIRRLGRERVHAIVERIITEVIQGDHDAERLASDVGLSKASLSRFAGTQWNMTGEKDGSAVPDLWRNAAHLMVSDPRFVEGLIAEDVNGVVDRLQELAGGEYE